MPTKEQMLILADLIEEMPVHRGINLAIDRMNRTLTLDLSELDGDCLNALLEAAST